MFLAPGADVESITLAVLSDLGQVANGAQAPGPRVTSSLQQCDEVPESQVCRPSARPRQDGALVAAFGASSLLVAVARTIFPAWFYTMHMGDYSILSRFVERRYNQLGGGISLMTVVMDASSGTSKARTARIQEEAKTALLGDMVNFPFPGVDDAIGNPDLGEKFRTPINTTVPTLFFSGTLDNNTPPFQADEVRRTFRNSTHIVVENAGHESMVVDSRVQQTMVDFLRGGDVSKTKIELPPLKFNVLPKPKN